MKYLDRVVITENCTYLFDNSTFSSLDAAIEYIQKIPFKTRLEAYGRTVTITIRNPYAPAIFNEALIPDHLMIKDCKDPLCIYAKERELTLAADLSEVYTEHFELYESADFGFEHIFDYGVLYGNYPVYTGKELCLSRISPDGEDRNLTFVPEPTGIYGVDRPNAIYKWPCAVYMAYDCYFVRMQDSGHVYDDGNGTFPFAAIPVSTFVNIGLAGINLPCWTRLTRSVETTHGRYIVNGRPNSLFRNALLSCKERELPEGLDYYTITIENPHADGRIPDLPSPCPIKESWTLLYPHATKRTVCISPSFDAVYWETFELLNLDDQTCHFCYDHALLERDSPFLQAGLTYHTSYWRKAHFEHVDIQAEVLLLSCPNPNAAYDGTCSIHFCCTCQLSSNPDKAQMIPACTLY